MPERSSSRNLPFARKLRREMTVAETMLWRALRGSGFKGMKFRRQVPVGPYVADFLCITCRLIVELDGPPHETDEQRAHDLTRDAFLCAQGFNVLRLPNDLVIGACDLALQQIDAAAERAKPSPALAGEGGLRRQPEPG
jgi:very-short-patch-repair endonuclease